MHPCGDHACDGCAWCRTGSCCRGLPDSPEHSDNVPASLPPMSLSHPSQWERMLADPVLGKLVRHLLALEDASRRTPDVAVRALYQTWWEGVAGRYDSRLLELGLQPGSLGWHSQQVWQGIVDEQVAWGGGDWPPLLVTSPDLDRFTSDHHRALQSWLEQHNGGAAL
jgi:hypothetical protein